MNSVSGRIVLYTLAGLAAGFLTWLFSDMSGVIHLSNSALHLTAQTARDQYFVGMAFGAFIAMLIAGTDLLLSGSWGQWPKALGLSLVVGLVSGVLGLSVGMILFGGLYVEPARNPLDFLRDVLARAIGWSAIGALAGTADGWRKGNVRVGRNGLIGGLIGGLLGGGTFEIIPYMVPGLQASPISRLFGFLITGACIGFFISLVQQLFKEAWIRVVLGRNEGKEYLVEKVETRIGRSELADVPLFGDAAVAKIHAMIVAHSAGRFVLRDVSNSPGGVLLNGARIDGDQPVRDGDEIRIANRLLVFRERFTKTRTEPVRRDLPRPAAPSTGFTASTPPAPTPTPSTSAPFPETPAPTRRAPSSATSVGARVDEIGRTGSFSVTTHLAPPMHTHASGAQLVATMGPHAGTQFPLPASGTLTIGRDPGANIAIPGDTKASRNHARLISNGNGVWVVEDNGSTNGTFVNGQKITRQELVSGDIVVIGTTSLRFE